MFITENKSRRLGVQEVFFGKSNFYHLTGVMVVDKSGKRISANSFYDLLLRGRIDAKNVIKVNSMTDLKLQVLPQLMLIDRLANMIGDFDSSRILLQTEKIAGNTTACMGFIKEEKYGRYVPNTVLKYDIRKAVVNREKIVAILKKDVKEEKYRNVTYLKKGYDVIDLLNNTEINKYIDTDSIYSTSRVIQEKICDYLDSK